MGFGVYYSKSTRDCKEIGRTISHPLYVRFAVVTRSSDWEGLPGGAGLQASSTSQFLLTDSVIQTQASCLDNAEPSCSI